METTTCPLLMRPRSQRAKNRRPILYFRIDRRFHAARPAPRPRQFMFPRPSGHEPTHDPFISVGDIPPGNRTKTRALPFERERFTSRLPSQFPTQFASPLGILPFCATASLCRAFLQRMNRAKEGLYRLQHKANTFRCQEKYSIRHVYKSCCGDTTGNVPREWACESGTRGSV